MGTYREYLELMESVAVQNKYTQKYLKLCAMAVRRGPIQGYQEDHHILPRSFGLGGSRDKQNLVALTAREHYIVHLFLVRMFEGQRRYKMLAAAFWMANRTLNHKGSRLYQKLRENYSKELSRQRRGVPVPVEILTARFGKFHDHSVTKPNDIHPSILVQETLDKFGYDPRFLKPQSNRKVLRACPRCGAVLKRPFYAVNNTTVCRDCLVHANLAKMNTNEGRSANAERMRNKWLDLDFREHTSKAVAEANRVRYSENSIK